MESTATLREFMHILLYAAKNTNVPQDIELESDEHGTPYISLALDGVDEKRLLEFFNRLFAILSHLGFTLLQVSDDVVVAVRGEEGVWLEISSDLRLIIGSVFQEFEDGHAS